MCIEIVVENATYGFDHGTGIRYRCNTLNRKVQKFLKPPQKLKCININARSIMSKVLELEHNLLIHVSYIAVISEISFNSIILNN